MSPSVWVILVQRHRKGDRRNARELRQRPTLSTRKSTTFASHESEQASVASSCPAISCRRMLNSCCTWRRSSGRNGRKKSTRLTIFSVSVRDSQPSSAQVLKMRSFSARCASSALICKVRHKSEMNCHTLVQVSSVQSLLY